MEHFIVELSSPEYKKAYIETKKRLKAEIKKGARLIDLEIIREPGETDNHYHGCLHAFNEAVEELKNRKKKKFSGKRISVVVGEIRECYGNRICSGKGR